MQKEETGRLKRLKRTEKQAKSGQIGFDFYCENSAKKKKFGNDITLQLVSAWNRSSI